MKMKKMKTEKMIKILLLLTLLFSGGVFLVSKKWFSGYPEPLPPSQPVLSLDIQEPIIEAPTLHLVAPPVLPKQHLISAVPFTVQAPFAEWSNPIFQDACEEASIIMAQAWVEGTSLTKEQAKKDIEALAKYEKKQFGHAVDTSIEDTRSLLRDSLGVKNSEVQRGVTIADIQEALASERLVIIPTDGRKLKNPNFKQPGPSRHMLVIVGYDTETKEFIVNDPGTRKGEGYRYNQAVLYDAMLDYPTGKHAEAKSTDKVMLTVWH